MRESAIRRSLVLIFDELLLSLVSLTNKWWARTVPAAAVIPTPQVEFDFIGSKAFVAG